MTQVNNNRPPTAKDREILAYLQKGQSLTHIDILNIFNSTCSRDHIYRLRKAGHPVMSETMYKKDQNGKVLKKWERYYISIPPEFPENPPKTDKQAKLAAKQAAEPLKKQNPSYGSGEPKFIEQELF